MKEKKILYYIQLPPPYHGVSIVNNYVWNNTKINTGIDKELLQLSFVSDMKDLGTVNLGKVFKLFSLMNQLKRKIAAFKPDYIYFSIAPTGKAFIRDLFFVSIIKMSKVKPIYHIHGKGIDRKIENKMKKRLYEIVFSNSIIIHLSKKLLVSEIGTLKLRKSNLHYVENGVLDYEDVGNRYHDTDDVHIVYVAVLSESKGIKTLLNIANSLCSEQANLIFDVVGTYANNEIEKYVNDFISINKLENNIVLHGYKSGNEKWGILSTGDIFLHPTFNDAFPIVLLEAMSCALPIVSTDVGAITEIVENNKNGFISPMGDEKSITRNLDKLIRDFELRKKMGVLSKEMYLKKYTEAAFEERMRKIFNSL